MKQIYTQLYGGCLYNPWGYIWFRCLVLCKGS